MKKYKSYIKLFFVLFISNIIAQNIEQCGLNDNFELTKTESDYLNNYLKKERNDFDFTEKNNNNCYWKYGSKNRK